MGAGPTYDPPSKNSPGGGEDRLVLDTGAQGTMSGRVGDLSPEQQEALTRVRNLGAGRLGQGASSPRGTAAKGDPGEWASRPSAPAHRLSRELGTHLAQEAPLWASLRLSPALHLCRHLSLEEGGGGRPCLLH